MRKIQKAQKHAWYTTGMLQLPTIVFLIALCVLASLHILSLQFSLYTHFAWLILPVIAFLGVIAALFLFVLRDLHVVPKESVSILTALISAALLCAIAVYCGIVFHLPFVFGRFQYMALEECVGIAGGIIGFYIGKRLRDLH